MPHPRRPLYSTSDPCGPLRIAVRELRDAYGEPRTRRQIEAWNRVEEALELTQRAFGSREPGHNPRKPG